MYRSELIMFATRFQSDARQAAAFARSWGQADYKPDYAEAAKWQVHAARHAKNAREHLFTLLYDN
jgi:hypothetical protein